MSKNRIQRYFYPISTFDERPSGDMKKKKISPSSSGMTGESGADLFTSGQFDCKRVDCPHAGQKWLSA